MPRQPRPAVVIDPRPLGRAAHVDAIEAGGEAPERRRVEASGDVSLKQARQV